MGLYLAAFIFGFRLGGYHFVAYTLGFHFWTYTWGLTLNGPLLVAYTRGRAVRGLQSNSSRSSESKAKSFVIGMSAASSSSDVIDRVIELEFLVICFM